MSPDGRFFWDGYRWVQVVEPPAAGFEGTALLWLVPAAAAIALIVSTFLPWISVDMGFMTVSRSGTDNGGSDPWLVVGAGLFILALLVARSAARLPGIDVFVFIVGGLVAALQIADLYQVTDRANAVNSSSTNSLGLTVQAHAGYGLLIGIAAAVAVALGAIFDGVYGPRRRRG